MEYYSLSTRDVLLATETTKEGLSERKAERRLEEYGYNEVAVKKRITFADSLRDQFKSYLVWLLVFIAIFAYFVGIYFNNDEQLIDGIVITIIVVVNVLVGAYQDYKSEKSAEMLKSMMKKEALVLRGGKKIKLESKFLVPGDVVLLEEGDYVPADCRILESSNLYVDESILTGESKPVLKDNRTIKRNVSLAEQSNMVFMNTFVVKGTALCVVVKTGSKTEMGKIAESLNLKQESPFVKEVDEASKKITIVALFLILIVVYILFMKGKSWLSIFMIASALVVGSIPEGLPAIVTFALSLGSLRLAKKNVLIKKKSLLETLGSIDILCTDKTGTLTENKMTVKRIYFEGKVKSSTKGLSKNVLREFENCALLCNEAKETKEGFVGMPEDIALIDFMNDNGNQDIVEMREKYDVKIDPFDSDKKYVKATVVIGRKTYEYKKGAPEVILKGCNKVMTGKGTVKLTPKARDDILSQLRRFSKESLRNIAFSYKVGKDSIFIGFVGLYDKPKKDVKYTIKQLYKAGVDVKMITGDNVHTAVAIAKECAFRDVKAINYSDFKEMTHDELLEKVMECNVFARMTPELKLEIVSLLQENGKRVAITGDGVNDVPALEKAEVGVAMGVRGTDIAKEASDIILLDDNIKSLINAVKEGRTIFSNVRKVINYLLTANLAEVLVVFLGSFYGVMPFLAIQLLWVNFVTDVAPAMSLGVDPSNEDILKRKPTGKEEHLINKRIVLLTVFIGLKKVIIMFLMFYIVYVLSGNLRLAQTMSFTWLVMSHFVRIAAIRFDEKEPLFMNKYVNWSVAIPILFQLLIIYTPLSYFFHTVPLTFTEWSIIIVSFVLAIWLAKKITSMIDKEVPERDY